MKYFDAHCHIQFSAYDDDRAEVIARMKEAEVGGLIVGCDLSSSKAAIELVKDEPEFFAAVGLHPNDTAEEYDASAFDALAGNPENKVRAIGECGLDYYRPDEPEEVKKRKKFSNSKSSSQ
jgi:TatD DNase family protein